MPKKTTDSYVVTRSPDDAKDVIGTIHVTVKHKIKGHQLTTVFKYVGYTKETLAIDATRKHVIAIGQSANNIKTPEGFLEFINDSSQRNVRVQDSSKVIETVADRKANARNQLSGFKTRAEAFAYLNSVWEADEEETFEDVAETEDDSTEDVENESDFANLADAIMNPND